MTVESWEPAVSAAELTTAVLEQLCAAASRAAGDVPDLDAPQVAALAPYARDGGPGSPIDWARAATTLDGERLVALIRFFTRAEMAFAAWKGGDRSPVIALAAELKRRGDFPDGLTAWIRANSDNRFLPYGSLLRRL